MFPAIIPNQLVHEFKFWGDGSVQRGMRYGIELYRYMASFPLKQSHQAYTLGTTLCEHQQQAVLTKSMDDYTVWLSLRSTEATSERSSSEAMAIAGVF